MTLPPSREWTLPGRGGVELFVRAWLPEAQPRDTVVIAHGYAEHSGRYGNVVDKLVPHGFAIYAIDHRGHGRSGGARGGIDRMDWVVEDLHGLVAKARAEQGGRKVKLLGHSMGGAVAFGYALRYPDDLSGLVLSGPAIGGIVSGVQRLILRILSALAPKVGTIELPAEYICRDPAVVAAYTSDPLVSLGKVPARTVGEMTAAARRYRGRASAMRVPVLVQHGGHDLLITPDNNREIYAAIGAPDTPVTIYPDFYHEIYNEPERDRVLDDLVAWLEAHPVG